MTERELRSLKDLAVPAPRAEAKRAAMRAALEAFDATGEGNGNTPPKGFPRRSRRTHTTSSRSRRRMMPFSRSTYAAAASLAVLAIAVPAAVVYMDSNSLYGTYSTPQPTGGILDMFSSGTESPGTIAGNRKLGLDLPAPRNEKKEEFRSAETTRTSSDEGRADENKSNLQVASVNEGKAAPPPAEPSHVKILQGASRSFDNSRSKRDGRTLNPPASTGLMSLGGVPGQHRAQGYGGTVRREVAKLAHNQLPQDQIVPRPENRDRFDGVAANPVKQVANEPVSTFSVDVDTSSYSFIRRALNSGQMPPKDAVRVEELINYFTYDYPRPQSATEPFKPTVTVVSSPWSAERQLVHIALKGYELDTTDRPRANLVFLIDVSGSMGSPDKLALLKQGLLMLLEKLRPDDSVGIVTYASGSGVALEPTKLSEKAKIQSAISQLGAGGSTAGAQGIQDAYRLAEQAFDKEAVNRVILGTDGDFNVGITDQGQLKSFIEEKRKTGIFLSVFGFGQGNYNDALMQALAQNGNGIAAYIDTLSEARKVLIEEASSTLFPIAKDVKIQIEFNPAVVRDYRLVGYETRALRRQDFNNDKIDAGDVGSGHAVTAIYEITPVGAEIETVDALRYQKPAAPQPAAVDSQDASSNELAFLKLRYKLPNEDTSKLMTLPVMTPEPLGNINAAPVDTRFAVAVAAFGQLLRGDPWVGQYGYEEVISLAKSAKGDDAFGLRAQFIELVRLAYVLSTASRQGDNRR